MRWQADGVAKNMDSKEIDAFSADTNAATEAARIYGDWVGGLPKEDF